MDNNVHIDTHELERILAVILKEKHADLGKVKVIDRVNNAYSSTFPSEIVTCQFFSGLKLKLFCKYIRKNGHQNNFGHRGGIHYEYNIYKNVLQTMKIKYPKFFGTYCDQGKRNVVLVLEYLEDTLSVDKVPLSILDATKWIAKFHNKSKENIQSADFSFLKKYDFEYYAQWANRTLEYTPDKLKQQFKWLPQLCEKYKSNLHLLLNDNISIIHGEYYPKNILYYRKQIVPIDWESAAFANGVIDLASLTEYWDKSIVEDCVLEYLKLIEEKHENIFMERFWLAQIYWHLRGISEWVEDINDSTDLNPIIQYYENMFDIGEKI